MLCVCFVVVWCSVVLCVCCDLDVKVRCCVSVLFCCGVIWCGVVWCGVVCCGGVIWCGVVGCGVVWYSVV